MEHSPGDQKRRIAALKRNPPTSPEAVLVWELVRKLCPEAPRPGLRAMVYLGVVKTGDRVHNVAVRTDGKAWENEVPDAPLPCVVTGYVIGTADAAGGWPWDHDTVDLAVRVRLLDWPNLRSRGFGKLLERDVTCGVSCLKCVPNARKG